MRMIQPANPKGNQSWIFIGRTDAEVETPVLWPPDVKNWLIWKDPDSGKDWRQEEKGTTEDEMAGWHHGCSGHEFEQAPGVDDGQGGLACCSPWGRKDLNTTKWLNWTEWEYLREGGEEGDRGWAGWMASLIQWTWVWASVGRQWRTGKPGMLQCMGSQNVRHDWVIEQQWELWAFH